MSRPTTLRLAIPLALSTAVLACGDKGSPTTPDEVTPVATTLRIADSAITLQVPQTTSVAATVYDQTGAAMPSVAPVWISRDSTTAKITPAGTVTAVETGDTWLIAVAAGLTDSVAIRVRYPVVEDRSRLRIRGADRDQTQQLSTLGLSFDFVGTDTLDRSLLDFYGADMDLLLVAAPPSAPGNATIQAWSIEDLLAGATILEVPVPGAYLVDTGQGETAYVGESGYLELTAVEAAADGERGRLQGHLHVRAVGYDLTDVDFDNPTVPPPGDTVTYDLDFDVSFLQHQMGYAVVDLDGGPIAWGPEVWDASVDWLGLSSSGDPIVQLTLDGDATLTAALLDPEPGTLSVFHQDPDGTLLAGRDVTSLRMTGYYPYFRASGQGGTVTLTTVDGPQAPSSGELSGSIDASLLYWLQGDSLNAETGTVQVEFHALWPPKADAQAAAATEDAPSPWQPILRPRGTR